MNDDQLPQTIPCDLRLRDDVVKTAVQPIQAAANVGDNVEQQTVPSARLQRMPPAEQETRQTDDDHQHR